MVLDSEDQRNQLMKLISLVVPPGNLNCVSFQNYISSEVNPIVAAIQDAAVKGQKSGE